MASRAGVLATWKLLEQVGLPRPWAGPDVDGALATWAMLLADVTDDRLLTLTFAWVRSPDARFGRWPIPGQLLAALGGSDEAVADEAWGIALGVIRRYGGSYTTPDHAKVLDACGNNFETAKAIEAGVAACGGWRLLARTDEGDLGGAGFSFRAAFTAARGRAKNAELEGKAAALLAGVGQGGQRALTGGSGVR